MDGEVRVVVIHVFVPAHPRSGVLDALTHLGLREEEVDGCAQYEQHCDDGHGSDDGGEDVGEGHLGVLTIVGLVLII